MGSNKEKRKLQISNGHYLLFDELAKLMNAIVSLSDQKKILMSDLEEASGLPFRQVRNRISIGRAMGLFLSKTLDLSAVGCLIAKYDMFFGNKGTLEWLHYKASSSYVNLVWFETFNTFLPHHSPQNYEEWLSYFRGTLAENYTEHSLKDHLGKEVRFLIDAYTSSGFSKLQLLYEASDGRISRRRYARPCEEVLAAMIYTFGANQGATLLQVAELVEQPASPGLLLAMDQGTLLQLLESLNGRGWLRLETTHNLAQVRLLDGYDPLAFLEAFYEKRKPVPTKKKTKEERMLL
ncbi:DUF4007 family protein [Verrucomicrobiota bacterium]